MVLEVRVLKVSFEDERTELEESNFSVLKVVGGSLDSDKIVCLVNVLFVVMIVSCTLSNLI